MATDYTANYHLDKYTATDKPNLRDQYNSAMEKIDTALLSANTNATEAKAGVIEAKANAAEAKNDAAEAKTSADEAKTIANAKADKTYVDGLEDIIQQRISDLAVMFPEIAFTEDSTVKDYVDTETDNRIKGINNGWSAVWIGDSFCMGQSSLSKRFSKIVSDMLGLTEYNYAVGSTGFTRDNSSRPGNTFPAQLSKAVLDTNLDKSKVKYVFITGGRNDASDDNDGRRYPEINAINNAVNEIISIFSGNFPNAKLVFIPMLYECVVPSSWQYRFYEQLVSIIYDRIGVTASTNVQVISKAYQWLQGKYTAVANDKIHPNQKGHNIIANCIYNALNGIPYSAVKQVEMTLNANYTYTGNQNYARLITDDDGTIWLHMRGNVSETLPFGTMLAEYRPNVAYGSADADTVMRGQKYAVESHGKKFLVSCSNNFSLNAASAAVLIQTFESVTGVFDFYAPIGKVGVDTALAV